jgi:hypothetical protein
MMGENERRRRMKSSSNDGLEINCCRIRGKRLKRKKRK